VDIRYFSRGISAMVAGRHLADGFVKVTTGTTEAMLKEMAAYRVRQLINRELRKQARQDAAG
jgi:hypothetical protein